MQITARVTFEDREHDQAVVAVQTSRCFYSVAIDEERATVIGPGVEREFPIGDAASYAWFVIPESLSFKGIAIFAVTMLEEENE